VVSRKLVFSRWDSLDTKPPFLYPQAFGDLHGKIEADPDSAVLEKNDATTAVNVIAAGSETEPAKIQLLALRTPGNRPS
jgi:hypothetical protein